MRSVGNNLRMPTTIASPEPKKASTSTEINLSVANRPRKPGRYVYRVGSCSWPIFARVEIEQGQLWVSDWRGAQKLKDMDNSNIYWSQPILIK